MTLRIIYSKTKAYVAFDPWYKSTLHSAALGCELKLDVPYDVFSIQKIDEGTNLLLENLPAGEPRFVLDVGCGYGALGLPIAAKFSGTKVDMIDRDLLAVAWAQKNALSNALANATAYPSLGYREVTQRNSRYDWILCNVPARIGQPFIENLFEGHTNLLSPDGEVRIVVISDLASVVEDIARAREWNIQKIASGPRHQIFALAAHPTTKQAISDGEEMYSYDEVKIRSGASEVNVKRPFDIAGDRVRVQSALPVLVDVLPRREPASIFCFRCGYGILPLLARKLWPGARVVAFDRDLLATTFARTNAERLGLGGALLEIRECLDVEAAFGGDEKYSLMIGEVSPSAGELVAERDLVAMEQHLEKGGQALILMLEKIEREWMVGIAQRRKLSLTRLIAREGYVVLRLTANR